MARLFLSTDDNAPVIAGNDRTCLVNLLKKCLVEGHGGKQPVGGWTMPYASADGRIACFRNDHDNGGLGHFLRVAQINDARTWDVRGYEDMTSENDGLFPYHNGSFSVDASMTNDAVIRPWVLLASKTWLALFMYSQNKVFPTLGISSSWRTSGFWFGDIEKWYPSDNYHSMLSKIGDQYGFGYTQSASSVGGASNDIAGRFYWFSRSSGGVTGQGSHHCWLPHPQSGAGFGTLGPQYDANSGLLIAKAAINDSDPYTFRGWIPDMLVPLHPRPFENLERISLNGRQYVAVSFSHNSVAEARQALFELDAGE